MIENCPTEYATFRELELAEKEKCYAKCNPSNINTKDKSIIKKSERAAIRECLDESNCFDLGIKHFEKESQFQAFKTCADLKCSAIEPKQKKPKKEKKEKESSTDSFWGAVRERKPMLYQDSNGGRIIYVGTSVDTRGMHLGHNGELVIPSPSQPIDPNDWRWRFVWDPKTSIQKYVYDPTMTYEDLLRMVR